MFMFNPNFQYGDYIVVRHRREMRRKLRQLRKGMLIVVPAEYIQKVKWTVFKVCSRAHDPLRRAGWVAWTVGPVSAKQPTGGCRHESIY